MSSWKIRFPKPGMYTLVIDQGRFGYQASGVPTGGPMDPIAFEMVNAILGISPDSPVLELTLTGPAISFEGSDELYIAITGADISPELNGKLMPMNTPFVVRNGDLLKFGALRTGFRAYLGMRAVWKLQKWLDSVSPLPGSDPAIPSGSIIKQGSTIIVDQINGKPPEVELPVRNLSPKEVVRIPTLRGPEWDSFTPVHKEAFLLGRFRIGSDSNRMGYRLEQALPRYTNYVEMISSGILPGTVQILNSGKPVVLMADTQTTGGYPRIAILTKEGMCCMAQCKPGDTVSFTLADMNY